MSFNDSEKKLEVFTNSILAKAMDDSHGVVSELSDKEKEIINKKKLEIEAEANRYAESAIAEIRAREGYKVNSRMTDSKRTLLQYREECANEVLEAVKAKIAAFTESDQYLPHLKALLQQAVDVFGYGFSAEVQLRPEDMKYADELAAHVVGVSLAFKEGHFELGGLCLYCPSKGKQVDLTFDEALTDLMGHFAEITGLRVDE